MDFGVHRKGRVRDSSCTRETANTFVVTALKQIGNHRRGPACARLKPADLSRATSGEGSSATVAQVHFYAGT